MNKNTNYDLLFTGIVIKGNQEARKLGTPTANIYISTTSLQEGVYSCNVVIKNDIHKAICYYGKTRPNILEAHIFNYNDNLYDKTITIHMRFFIRKPINNIPFTKLKALIVNDLKLCQELEKLLGVSESLCKLIKEGIRG